MSRTTLKGADKMSRKLKAIAKKFPSIVAQSAFVEGELIMTKSKKDHVPVDLGTLRSSGQVTLNQEGRDIEVVMSYGGAAAPYALAIHEHPSESTPPSWKNTTVTFSPIGRGPKYLERPLMGAVPGMDRRIAERVKKRLEKEAEGDKS
jgi:hypothetical protein